MFVKQEKDSPVIGRERGEALWFGANNKLLHCPDSSVLFHKHNVSQLHEGISQVTLTTRQWMRRTGAVLFGPPFTSTVYSQVSWHDNKHFAGYGNCYSKSNKCDRLFQCLVVTPRDNQ